MTFSVYDQEGWADHERRLKWRQGEHILIAGPTSAGKTTLASHLLQRRSHVVMIVTKVKDETFKREFKGWTIMDRWPKGGPPNYETRILLWPTPQKTIPETIRHQREVIGEAINAMFRQGRRCICIDEGLYFSDSRYLGMGTELGMLHYTARSSGISMVTLSQRPFYLPKVILSSITHGYFARTRDKDDLKRLSDIGSVDAKEVAYNLGILGDRHDYVYVNPQGDGKPSVVNTAR